MTRDEFLARCATAYDMGLATEEQLRVEIRKRAAVLRNEVLMLESSAIATWPDSHIVRANLLICDYALLSIDLLLHEGKQVVAEQGERTTIY